jgi:SPX domain protein involved in polyphosphate accumulation
MTDTNTLELMKRLEALEAENKRLKEKTGDAPAKLEIKETEFKGHPMLEFKKGNSRPFSMSVKKLTAIHEGWEQVQAFLKKHNAILSDNPEQI